MKRIVTNVTKLWAVFAACSLTWTSAAAASLFEDDFTGGADALWGNESGSWTETAGTYIAGTPNNFPASYSSLPFDLSDFTIEADISNVSDGGIWLHSTHTGIGAIGAEGVLLVTNGPTLYWHVATSSSYRASLNAANVGSYSSLRIEVVGDTYSAFVDGSSTAATTLTSSTYSSGRVALYSNSANQAFDNVVLVPEPASLALLSLGGLLVARRRRN